MFLCGRAVYLTRSVSQSWSILPNYFKFLAKQIEYQNVGLDFGISANFNRASSRNQFHCCACLFHNALSRDLNRFCLSCARSYLACAHFHLSSVHAPPLSCFLHLFLFHICVQHLFRNSLCLLILKVGFMRPTLAPQPILFEPPTCLLQTNKIYSIYKQ